MLLETIPGLSKLTPADKLQLASELWENALIADENDMELKKLLDEALNEYRENPDNVLRYEEVLARLNLRKWRGKCAGNFYSDVDDTIEALRGR